jgi:hypothetical protein
MIQSARFLELSTGFEGTAVFNIYLFKDLGTLRALWNAGSGVHKGTKTVLKGDKNGVIKGQIVSYKGTKTVN